MAGIGDWLRGGFGGKNEQHPDASLPQATASAEADAVGEPSGIFAGHEDDFALPLYGQLRQGIGNLFFSPYSVRSALAMAWAGARGETAAQMARALRFAQADKAVHSALAAITRSLNASGGGAYEMAVANSLWAQCGTPLVAEYLDTIARHYGGAATLVDFRGRAEDARAAINQWVEEKTRRKILDLIPPGGVQADTRLVLANAVWFKGLWERQFSRGETRGEPFYLEGGGTTRAPLMHQRGMAWYADGPGWQAVDLPYRGFDLSMLVLLPDRQTGLRDLEARLSTSVPHVRSWMGRVREVEIFLPRFRMTWGTADLSQPLRALGMPLAFAPSQADFSGINGREPSDSDALFLSEVYHKAFVEVNEEGTEAAAATSAHVALLGLPPPPAPPFRADHPFLFAIRHQRSGTILFLGRVADPTRES